MGLQLISSTRPQYLLKKNRKIRQGLECIARPWTTAGSSCPIWKVSAQPSCVLLPSSHLQAGTELPFGPCLWKSLTIRGIILTRLETPGGGWTNFFELLVHKALTTNMVLLLIRITSEIGSIATVSHRTLQKRWPSLNFLPKLTLEKDSHWAGGFKWALV